jgi:hypothetical protein
MVSVTLITSRQACASTATTTSRSLVPAARSTLADVFPTTSRRRIRGAIVSEMGEMFSGMRQHTKELRAKFGVPCPVCVTKLPRACPSILLPAQRCRIHGYRDPRPRSLTDGFESSGVLKIRQWRKTRENSAFRFPASRIVRARGDLVRAHRWRIARLLQRSRQRAYSTNVANKACAISNPMYLLPPNRDGNDVGRRPLIAGGDTVKHRSWCVSDRAAV